MLMSVLGTTAQNYQLKCDRMKSDEGEYYRIDVSPNLDLFQSEKSPCFLDMIVSDISVLFRFYMTEVLEPYDKDLYIIDLYLKKADGTLIEYPIRFIGEYGILGYEADLGFATSPLALDNMNECMTGEKVSYFLSLFSNYDIGKITINKSKSYIVKTSTAGAIKQMAEKGISMLTNNKLYEPYRTDKWGISEKAGNKTAVQKQTEKNWPEDYCYESPRLCHSKHPKSQHVSSKTIQWAMDSWIEENGASREYTMYYTRPNNSTDKMAVTDVYFVPTNYTPVMENGKEVTCPPHVEYFTLRPDDNLLGAWVEEVVKKPDGHLYRVKRELIFDEVFGDRAFFLLADETQYHPATKLSPKTHKIYSSQPLKTITTKIR